MAVSFWFLWSWVLAIWAQATSFPLVSAAATLIFEPLAFCFPGIGFFIVQFLVISRQMSSWRRQRPRPRRRKPQHLLAHITSSCAQTSMLTIRTVSTIWLVLVCSGICTNYVASALDFHSSGEALHSELNAFALRNTVSPASRQLPDLGLQPRLSAFALRILPEHPVELSSPAFTHHTHFDLNVTNSSSRCTSHFLVASLHHMRSRQTWLAAAHSLVTSASALHAPAALNATNSSCSTAFHLAVAPQGPQSAFCALPTYASASDHLPLGKLLPPSRDFNRLSSRGGRLSALQRFGAAAEGVMQLTWRLALRLSSWGGGARDTLAAAVDRAGRFGAAAHQLWRQVRAQCTVTPSICMYSSGATVLELGGGRLGRFLCVHVVLVSSVPVVKCCCCQ
jgi:hypothetical protein